MSSPIDDLFFDLYGSKPSKDGQAYERLVAAVFKLLEPDKQVEHDRQIRGEVSGTKYQVDVLQKDDDKKLMGEAKDYTERNTKVGRGDVQKLAGALPDLKIQSAALASATGFTKPAAKYASNAKNIVGSDISLWEVRKVTEGDMEGRLKTITIKMHVMSYDYSKSKTEPVFTDEGRMLLKKMYDEGIIGASIQTVLESIFNADGSVLVTLRDLTLGGYGSSCDNMHRGSFVLNGGHILVHDKLIPIKGITYEVPSVEVGVREMVIGADGVATLLAKNLDGSVDKVIRDVDLKRVAFDKDGKVTLGAKGSN
ncbi:restriction endonuclease [Prosthecobacter fluviatilis]|uniref:Restriction endonuclease n=1 Tax=Prosthecobacter fluviatilis TaxID=445931 RepID=A0ABW0KPI6_9BACT